MRGGGGRTYGRTDSQTNGMNVHMWWDKRASAPLELKPHLPQTLLLRWGLGNWWSLPLWWLSSCRTCILYTISSISSYPKTIGFGRAVHLSPSAGGSPRCTWRVASSSPRKTSSICREGLRPSSAASSGGSPGERFHLSRGIEVIWIYYKTSGIRQYVWTANKTFLWWTIF
jgi:hypothetical protein